MCPFAVEQCALRRMHHALRKLSCPRLCRRAAATLSSLVCASSKGGDHADHVRLEREGERTKKEEPRLTASEGCPSTKDRERERGAGRQRFFQADLKI